MIDQPARTNARFRSMMVATAALALLAALSIAGCGGGGHRHGKSSLARAASFAAKPGLLAGASSAGASASYVPKGKVIADSGFRPWVNGFAFENYANNAGPVNLTPVNVEHLFGARVCASGIGNSCVLIPSAKQWMDEENAAMADGHCMGFSVTALRFFTQDLRPSSFGARQTALLPVQDNTTLQSLIAEDFSYQSLASVRRHAIGGTPSQMLRTLVNALNAKNETYTLAIVKADGTGGHAITPFAVEDRGHGKFAIIVYDNNFPGVARAVNVDTAADTWRYVGGVNPSDTSEIYEGDARTQSMFLLPTTPGEGAQPCPFCSQRPGANPDPSALGPSFKGYIEVAIGAARGRTDEHPHLLFVDPKTGAKTGYVGGRIVHQIPGVLVNENLAVQNWSAAPEPTYDLPFHHPQYEVFVDGSNLTHPVTEKITVNGGGILWAATAVHVAPRQKDLMVLASDDLSLAYASGSKYPPVTPVIAAELPVYYRLGGRLQARLVLIETFAAGYAPTTAVELRLDPKTHTAIVGDPGRSVRLYTRASHFLWYYSLPVPGHSSLPLASYRTENLKFDPNTQLAQFDYVTPRGKSLPVEILGPSATARRSVDVPSFAAPRSLCRLLTTSC